MASTRNGQQWVDGVFRPNGGRPVKEDDPIEQEFWRERLKTRSELYKQPCHGRIWARSPSPPEHSDDDRLTPPDEKYSRRRNKLMDTASTDSDSDMKRRKIRRKDKRSESSSDSESEDNERHQSRKKKAKKERKSHKKHKKRKSKRRKNSKDKRGHASNSDLDEDRKNELENQLLQTKQQSRVIQEDDWVEAPSVPSQKASSAEEDDEEEDDIIGPEPPMSLRLNRQKIGDRMLRGEADAIADYVEEGKRIPRRGEIGLTSDQIEDFETQGYIMSGSRNTRMEAVRLRKENEIYDAERQRQMALANQEAREKRNNMLIAEMREYLHKQHKKIVKERDPTIA